MTTIGYAVLQIIPSLDGVSEAIEKQIDGKVVEVKVAPKVDKQATDAAGRETREGVEKHTKEVAVEPKVDKTATNRAGKEAGESIAKEAKDAVRKGDIGKEVAEDVTTSVKKSSPGRDIAKVIVEGLADGVKQGLPKGSVGEAIIDGIADGVNKGIDSKGLGTEIIGSIGRVLKKGDLAGTVKDAVLPGITQIGTDLRSGAAEWSRGIAGSLRSGDIQGAAGDIANTVVTTTDKIAGIADAFGLPSDAIRTFGTDAGGVIGALGDDVQGVVDTIGEFKGAAELAGVDMDKAFMAASRSPGLLALGASMAALAAAIAYTIKYGDTVENPHTQTSGGTGQPQLPGAGLPDGSHLGVVPLPPDTKLPDGFELGPDGQLQKKGTPAPVVVPAPPQTTTLNPNRLPGTPLPPDMKLPDGFELGPDGTLRRKQGHAGGGQITGPGGPMSDVIPIWASNGEFIVRAAAARENLPLLEAINSGNMPKFAGGGLVAGDQQLRQIIMERFGISDIGGYRPADKYGEHSTGRALDVMVGANKSKGDAVKDFALSNASAIDLKWVIWRQHLYYPGGGGYDMPDRGSPTQNHMDHVHIFSGTGIVNGLRGALAGGPGAGVAAGVGVPGAATAGGPGAEDTSAADQTAQTASATSSSGGGVSLPSSFSGLSSFGLDSLGSGAGTTNGGTDLGVFGQAAGSAVSGQVSSALGVFGVNDSPGFLKAATKLVGGIKVSDSSGKSLFDGSNLLGGGAHSAAPLSATSTSTGTPPPDNAGNMHGTRAGQQPGPGTVYNITARDTEDAFVRAQRVEREKAAAKLSRF